MKKFDYSVDDLKIIYSKIPRSEFIFVSTGLANLGRLKDASSLDQLCKLHYCALIESFPSTTLVIPSYSYTFGESIPGSLACFSRSTPSKIGPFSNYLIKHNIGKRSSDPMVSVIAIGPEQTSLLKNLPRTSYGHDSIFERLLFRNTICMSVGLGTNWTPFIHYLDYINMVPYRYDKLFCGYIQNEENSREKVIWNYSVPVRKVNAEGNGIKLGKLAEYEGFWRQDQIGRGLINTISYKEYFDFASNLSKSNRWLTASGPPISIEFDRDLDHSSLDKTSNQVDKNGVPILGSHFRPLVGDNLDDIYTDLKSNLTGATIDFFKIHTGANLGGHVLPEAWIPLSLEIKARNQEPLVIDNYNLLTCMVHEYSRSFSVKEQTLSEMNLFNLDNCDLKSYQLCTEPVFDLKRTYKNWFVQRFKLHDQLDLTFKADLQKSAASFILLRNTKCSSRKLQSILIDSLAFSQNKDFYIKNVVRYLEEGFDIIVGPCIYSYHYSLRYLKSTNIFSVDMKKLRELTMPYGPNSSDNDNINKFETLAFCLV